MVVNRSYHELAEYYGTAIVPTCVRKPKDYQRKNVIGNLSLNKRYNRKQSLTFQIAADCISKKEAIYVFSLPETRFKITW